MVRAAYDGRAALRARPMRPARGATGQGTRSGPRTGQAPPL